MFRALAASFAAASAAADPPSGRADAKIVVADVPAMKLAPGRHAVEAVPPKNDANDNQRPIAAMIVVDKPAQPARLRWGRKTSRLLPGVDRQRGEAGAERRLQRYARRLESRLPLRPNVCVERGEDQTQAQSRAGSEQSGRSGLDLTAPSYGIHGTPLPQAIGKTESHGCIRLANWDAVDLAMRARPGTVVRFDDHDSPVAPQSAPVRNQQPEPDRQRP